MKEEEDEEGGGEVAASKDSDFPAASGSPLRTLTLASLASSRRSEDKDNGASCTTSGVPAVN